MTRFADPRRCPDCGQHIDYGASSCGHCDLPLSGETAGRLFATLSLADDLLEALRADRQAPAAVAAPARPSGRVAARPVQGLSAASVPKILLGLGALCLLVAGLVFLAVTWSLLGVGGRTATLAVVTALTGVASWWVARRDLRAASESLTLVTFGLLTLDLFGADSAGWFGNPSWPAFVLCVGAVLAAAGAGAALLARRTPVHTLVTGQVVAAVGVLLVVVGVADSGWLAHSAGLVTGVLIGGTAAAAAHVAGLRFTAIGSALVGGLVWAVLLLDGLERALLRPTLRELWLDVEGWPLLAAAALAITAAFARPLPGAARRIGPAVGQVVAGALVLVPLSDQSVTEATLGVVALLVVTAVAAWFLPQAWVWGSVATLGLTGLWAAAIAAVLAAASAERLVDLGERLWSAPVSVLLPRGYDPTPAPWLAPIAVVAVVATVVVLAERVPVLDRVLTPVISLPLGAALLAGALVVTAAAYPVPAWSVLAVLLLAVAGLVCWAHLRRDPLSLVLATPFGVTAVILGLADEWLTTAALAVLLVAAAVTHHRWHGAARNAPGSRDLVRASAGAVAAPSSGGLVWAVGALLSLERPWLAACGLVLLGVTVLVPQALRHGSRARVGFETTAAVTGAVLAVAGVAAAADATRAGWTAAYLTLGGVALTALALLRPDRRLVAWPGGLLLAAATWVRLWEVGVEEPEAYTLPSAVALLGVGLLHLRRHPDTSTTRALSPGLTLALLPSLVWALAEPVTLRSVLLGAACLALVVVGLRLRWTAPVTFAAVVGAALVLRHLTPVADAVPRWALIGMAGALLVGMGITWEQRLRQARLVVGYVRALR